MGTHLWSWVRLLLRTSLNGQRGKRFELVFYDNLHSHMSNIKVTLVKRKKEFA